MKLFDVLNGLHPSLQFKMENEYDGILPFIFREAQWWQCIERQVLLVYWPDGIPLPDCPENGTHAFSNSKSTQDMLSFIVKWLAGNFERNLCRNGYPLHLVRCVIKHMENNTDSGIQKPDKKNVVISSGSHPILLCLPWIGMVSKKYSRDYCANWLSWSRYLSDLHQNQGVWELTLTRCEPCEHLELWRGQGRERA